MFFYSSCISQLLQATCKDFLHLKQVSCSEHFNKSVNSFDLLNFIRSLTIPSDVKSRMQFGSNNDDEIVLLIQSQLEDLVRNMVLEVT